MAEQTSKVIRFEMEHEDGSVWRLSGDAAAKHVADINRLCAVACAHNAHAGMTEPPWEFPPPPPEPGPGTAVEAPDLDPFLVHELLHGASLAVDLLETVGGGDVYAPVWAAAPEAKRAFDAAVEAAAAFYGAMGQVSVGDPLRAPAAERPREGAAEGDGYGYGCLVHDWDPSNSTPCPYCKESAAPASPGDGAKETP